MDTGSTFVPSQQLAGIDYHLWVVLSDPDRDPARVLLVSFTTWEKHKDQACILQPGEHPWVRHTTCVAYGQAKVISLDKLKDLRYAGQIVMQAPLSSHLLQRIRSCAADSTSMEEGHADILIEQGLLEV